MLYLKVLISFVLLATLYSGCGKVEHVATQDLNEMSEREMVLLFFEQERELFHDIIDIHGGVDIYIGLNEDAYYEPGTPFECYLHGENGENENSSKGRKCCALVGEITEEANNLFNQYYGVTERAIDEICTNFILKTPGTDFKFRSYNLNHGIKYHTGEPTALEEKIEENWYYYSYPVMYGEDEITAYFKENQEKFERVLEYHRSQSYEFASLNRTLINRENEIIYEFREEGIVFETDINNEVIQAFEDLDATISSISYYYYKENDADFCEFTFLADGWRHGIAFNDNEPTGFETEIVDNWYYFWYPNE